ncbi:MAG TPA: MMPL family transporter [Acidimicrobiia bacterium]|nr:MMPL family transporter [Acidimicrobiia bacterium]
MRRLARWVVRGRWIVIVGAVVFLIVAGVLGAGVKEDLSAGGFEDPGSESTFAAEALLERFPSAGEPDFVILVTAKSGSVDDEDVTAVATELVDDLATRPEVIEVGSYWTSGKPPPLRSTGGDEALIFAILRGDLDMRVKAAEHLSEEFTVDTPVIRTAITGISEVARQVSDRSEKDLLRSELITAPIVGIALILVFGSLVAAGLPLAIGILAIVGTLLVLTILASLTEVSVFAMNLTTGLGLGLAIDYALFIVSRYREELASGVSSRVAVARTLQTAGRTVAFSAGTVMISLMALLLFPQPYLRSFAYAGVAVVGLAAVAAIIVLPAILAALGPRVEKGQLFKHKVDDHNGFWGLQALRVMRRPWIYAISVVAILVTLAIPFFSIQLGQIDDRVIPPEVASSRAATDRIREDFESRENGALRLFLPGVDPVADVSDVDTFAKRLRDLAGVARVDAASGVYYGPEPTDVCPEGDCDFPPEVTVLSERFFSEDHPTDTWVNVVPDIEPISGEGEDLVDAVRATRAPFDFTVAGPSARLVDTKATIGDRLPIALGAIALVTFVLLFLMTGSLLVPLKALILNILSLTATFGAMVFIFQEGRFTGFLGYTETGFIDTFTPVLMFCIAFGLSMDYEVFLLSRIKEEYDYDHDNERAVAVGLGKTGRIVTAAALLLTIVFLGLTTSKVFQVKLFGLGLMLAILVDAFLIRATLVPAFMRLAGRLNWWSPRFLRRFHLRFGIWENEPIKILDREIDATP